MKISTYTIKGGLPHCSLDGKVEAYDIVRKTVSDN